MIAPDAPPEVAQAAVARFIREGGPLEPAALALHRWQRRAVPALAALLDDREPATLDELPAAPVALFQELRFCAVDPPGRVFLTSGTTSGRRGQHALPDTRVYDLSARTWFERLLPGCPVARTVSLCTDGRAHPESSLGHMVQLLAPGARVFFDPARGVDAPGAWAALAEARGPVFLPATAFALAELLEHPGEARLAEGSVLMITGGFKGRAHTLDQAALLDAARARLGGRLRVVGEYGMTELSSQCWDLGAGFLPPPWLHVCAVNPATGLPVQGEGLLRFVDLANWGSCLAIETQDLGEVVDGRVFLHGRLSEAPARGCSLTVEEARAARTRP